MKSSIWSGPHQAMCFGIFGRSQLFLGSTETWVIEKMVTTSERHNLKPIGHFAQLGGSAIAPAILGWPIFRLVPLIVTGAARLG